jgi:para-nitrobenzyl esterase
VFVIERQGISRRRFVVQGGMAALALRGGELFSYTARGRGTDAGVLVRTRSGMLRGEVAGGVRVFRGIPFAAPPVGELRFRAPERAAVWTGEREARAFAASPTQPGEKGIAHSEDCLYLNVWAPEGQGPFPVFVWIHGGGFLGGHSFETIYDGSELARAGIVCVTVAYRLGVFGFLDMEALLGPSYAGSANNGLRDLIRSLEWVQQNIEALGGDPVRVTVGGESAGAKLTDILMGVPSATGLFHQMISESGGADRVWPREGSAAVATGYGDDWRGSSGRDLASLRTADPMELIETQTRFIRDWPQHFPLRSEIDGKLVPRPPVETIAAGSTRGKRLLIGTNREESALFVGPHPEHDAIAGDLGNVRLERFDQVYAKYKDIYPEMSAERRRIQALTAEEYWVPSVRVADAHVKGGGSAWMYRLDFEETSGRLAGYAYHALDVGLVWEAPHVAVENALAEAALGKQVHQAWVSFIRGETPTAQGLPTWPEYRHDTRATMLLDTTSRVEERPQSAELRLWDGVM